MSVHEEKTWEDGYIDGYQSVRGPHAVFAAPVVPLMPLEKTPYEAGYERGRDDAAKRRD
ncbi:hypothetical protein [Reyranella sp.]|uniref:hypothetical protein n=1 Tax=Reyranella sp. TaxID=1929291 RepID=UPI002730FE0B|nr:hypothetical protein [Reyranella sp.]MDP2377070.1 hypothetical protein [Reyranella sp.]